MQYPEWARRMVGKHYKTSYGVFKVINVIDQIGLIITLTVEWEDHGSTLFSLYQKELGTSIHLIYDWNKELDGL